MDEARRGTRKDERASERGRVKEEIERLILLAETLLGPAHRRDEGRVLISPRPPFPPQESY